MDLYTAPPDGRPLREHAEDGTFKADQTRTERGNGGKRRQEALRAILRAPQPIQALYRADLIGQKEAALLGPDRPTP